MLRHAVTAVVGTGNSTSAAARQRWLTTSAQKRALNPDQIRGTKEPPAARPPPTGLGAPKVPPPGGGGDSSLLTLGAAAALVAAGGGAYYYYSTTKQPLETVETPAATSKVPKEAIQKEILSSPKSSEAPLQVAPVTSESASGNRVLSIAVPPKMKNSETTAVVTPPSHPEGGNRVLTSSLFRPTAARRDEPPSPQRATSIGDTSPTRSALKALQSSTTLAATEAVLQSHQSLWGTSNAMMMMDENFFADLDSLTVAQLKARVMQQATELKDRTKWEAVRLKEFLAMKEKETADKYLEILQKQRLEFEDLLAKRLREQDNELSTRMYNALQEKEATIQSVLSTALEAQKNEHEADKKAFEEIITGEIQSALDEEYGKRLEEYKRQVAQELQQKLATMNTLTQKLQHLEAALEASKTSKEGSLKAHRLSAAALALAEKLETNVGAASELAALKLAAGTVGVISTACATIPDAVKTGVPTLPELQARFERAVKKCRQAALVPAGRPGLEGQLAGMVFATLKYPPDADDPAPESDKDSAEYVLVRAQKHVQLGELELAVEQLDKLTGQPAFTIADWKKDAINRIAVEKALKVIKMECALLNESCLDED